ncbi:MAG: lactonase family protein, partial [Deltaproteobacteria bacterium]
MLTTTARTTNADEPLVFVSAFAAGDAGAIHAFQLDANTGALKAVHRTTGVEHPFFLALSRNRRFLYSIHAKQFGGADREEVAAYEIAGRTGRLKLLNRQSARGSAACYLELDATGRTLLVANYATGSVAALPVHEGGSLGEAASFVQHTGSSINPERQKEPHAHCIVVSPDNRFVLSADLGLDQILNYRLDPATAKLSPNRQPFVRTPPGAGPRHLTFHPDG